MTQHDTDMPREGGTCLSQVDIRAGSLEEAVVLELSAEKEKEKLVIGKGERKQGGCVQWREQNVQKDSEVLKGWQVWKH